MSLLRYAARRKTRKTSNNKSSDSKTQGLSFFRAAPRLLSFARVWWRVHRGGA